MKDFIYENGQEAEDVVTGFRGIITGRSDFITGCNQYGITAKATANGETKTKWIDEPRIKLIGKKKKIEFPVVKEAKPGGPADSYPELQ